MNNDLISREALKKALTSETRDEFEFVCLSRVLEKIDNALTVKINTNDIEYKAYCKGLEDGKKIARPQGEKFKLTDEQIEQIIDLLETEWGYEGVREDVLRILKGGANE